MQLRFWNLCLNRLFAQDRFHDLRSTGVGGRCNWGLYVVFVSTLSFEYLCLHYFRQAELLWEQFFCNFQERVVSEASSTLGVLKNEPQRSAPRYVHLPQQLLWFYRDYEHSLLPGFPGSVAWSQPFKINFACPWLQWLNFYLISISYS